VRVGRLGIWASSRLLQGPETPDAAAELEELGFGALWIGSAPRDMRLVTDLLAATRAMRVATGIVNIWTEPPEQTAQAYAAASSAYPDRVLLGIGAGHKATVEATTGQRWENPYGKLVSYLDTLDAAQPPVPQHGRAVAALGPRVVALAGQRSAGAHPYLVTPEHTQRAREILGPGPLLAPEQTVVLDTDPDTARAVARETLIRYLSMPNYTNNWLRLGFTTEDFEAGGSNRLVDAMVVWGDEQAIRNRVDEHHQAGADHVCLQVLTAAVLSRATSTAGWRRRCCTDRFRYRVEKFCRLLTGDRHEHLLGPTCTRPGHSHLPAATDQLETPDTVRATARQTLSPGTTSRRQTDATVHNGPPGPVLGTRRPCRRAGAGPFGVGSLVGPCRGVAAGERGAGASPAGRGLYRRRDLGRERRAYLPR
jgi:probable F420-dependent oxidoreductase